MPAGVQCGLPVQQCAYGEDIANGMITDNSTDSGEQVQSLTCDPGYQAVGDVTKRECNHTTGNWKTRFSCEGRMCPPAPNITNGYFVNPDDQKEFRLPMMLMYRCNDNAKPANGIVEYDVTYLVMCALNVSSGELYWRDAERLPVCIEDIVVTVAAQTALAVAVSVGIIIPLIIVAAMIVIILAGIVFYNKLRKRRRELVGDELAFNFDTQSEKSREILEFGNPLYNDEDTQLVDPTEPDTVASGTTEAAAFEDTIKEATTEI